MFNKSGITNVKGTNTRQILFTTEGYVAAGAVIDDAAFVSEDGRKLVKAGTPVAGDLTARGTAFTKANADGSDVVGILVHDVDVTNGNANGTVMIGGYVNVDRVDATTAALYVEAIKKSLKGSITFLK